jgi:hypothetical protein
MKRLWPNREPICLHGLRKNMKKVVKLMAMRIVASEVPRYGSCALLLHQPFSFSVLSIYLLSDTLITCTLTFNVT